MKNRWTVPYKKVVTNYAEVAGRNAKAYHPHDDSKAAFNKWRKAFREADSSGANRRKPSSKSPG